MDKFRLLAQKDEIFNMVKKAPVHEVGEIWQTQPIKREVYKVKRMEVLKEALIFHTTLPFEFEETLPIYIKVNYKNLIFKLNPGEFRISNNMLSCVYPKEAKALESRNIERTKLPKKNNLHVTLRPLNGESSMDVKVSLLDVSEAGMGVRTSVINQEFFQRNSTFRIVKVCGRFFIEEGVLTVKHMTEKDSKSHINVGLSCEKTFSDKLFAILREEIKKERFAKMA